MKREDVALLASLFARVGMYVSHCDDTDLDETSEEEEKAQMLRAFRRIEKASKSPLIAAAANEAAHVLTVPDNDTEEKLSGDIRDTVQMLVDGDEAGVLSEFRKALMYVGTSVARAYKEELDQHEDEFLMESFMRKITTFLNQSADPREFRNQNISPAEDSALTMISEALRT